MTKIELRMNPTSISTTDDGKLYCEGLVNKTGAWSNEMGISRRFVEKIEKGAFTKAISKATRIDFLSEHDTKKLLATTENGSLELFEDDEGLKMRAEICPTTYGNDAYALMKSGIFKHMSFGFKVLKDRWTKRTTGLFERVVEELALAEVSVVRNPAYSTSMISARNIEIVEDVDIPEVVEDSKEEIMEEKEKQGAEVTDNGGQIVTGTIKASELVVAEAQEQRAYFSPIYTKEGAMNRCLDVITNATELIAYANEFNIGTSAVSSLQATVKSATEFMLSLTDVPKKEISVGDVVAEVVSEVVDSIVEDTRSDKEEKEVVEVTEQDSKTSENIKEIKDDVKEEIVEEKQKDSAIDYSQYHNKIKEDLVYEA